MFIYIIIATKLIKKLLHISPANTVPVHQLIDIAILVDDTLQSQAPSIMSGAHHTFVFNMHCIKHQY